MSVLGSKNENGGAPILLMQKYPPFIGDAQKKKNTMQQHPVVGALPKRTIQSVEFQGHIPIREDMKVTYKTLL